MKTKISSRKQLEEFVKLVAKVREAQKLYFKTKSKYELLVSVSLEKKLDSLLSQIVDEEVE